MNNDERTLEFQEEIFEFVLNVENNRVSVPELRRLLLHSERLVKSINKTLRDVYPELELGFDIVDLNVLAIEKCCFKLSFSISKKNRKKIKEITHNPTFVAIVGAVIAGLFAAKPSTQVNQVNNTYQETVNVTIDNRVILENRIARDSVDCISTLVINNDSIHDFSINYQGNDGMVSVQISKEQLWMMREELNHDHRMKQKTAFLEVLYYDAYNRRWKFRYHERIIEAIMHDQEFYNKVHLGTVDLKRGDFIRVELIIEKDGQNSVYHIGKVIGYYSE